MWEALGIGEAIRTRMDRAELTAPHELALFAMAAHRLDDRLEARLRHALAARHRLAAGGRQAGG